jgi:hypothetical protein
MVLDAGQSFANFADDDIGDFKNWSVLKMYNIVHIDWMILYQTNVMQ